MNRLESIKEALAEYKADEDLLSPPERGYLEDVEYLLQRLEIAQKALKGVVEQSNSNNCNWCGDTVKVIAEEALKEE